MYHPRKEQLEQFYDFFKEFPAEKYCPKETILNAWENTSMMFCIDKGFVKDYSLVANGDERLRIFLGPGDIFPLASLVYHRDQTIYQTVTTSFIRKAPRYKFMLFLHANPSLMRPILHQALMAEKVLTVLEQPDAYTRLATRLTLKVSLYGLYTEEGDFAEVRLPLNHADIAASCNISRETATRLLKKMQIEGLIEYRHNFIRIDLHKLSDHLSVSYDYPKKLMEYL